MSLISFKTKLKLRWSNHFIFFFEIGKDNDDGNTDNIIFAIKYTKLYVPVATLLANDK